MADASDDNAAQQGSPPSSSQGLPLPAIAAGVLTLSTLVGFAYLFSVWASSGEITPHEKLRMASAQYVAGNQIVAGNLANQVILDEENEDDVEVSEDDVEVSEDAVIEDEVDEDNDEVTDDDENEDAQVWLALKKFLSGAGTFYQAMQMELPRDRRNLLKEALPSLQAAQELGFPDGRSADGYRMLGIANKEMGDYEAATNYLQKAIDFDLTLQAELTPLLAISSARRPREDLDEAIQAINGILAQESLDVQKRTETELLKIQWLIDLKRFDEASRIIENAKTRIEPAVDVQERWALNAADSLLLMKAQRLVRQTLAGVVPPSGSVTIAGIPASVDDQVTQNQKDALADLRRELTVMQREAAPKTASLSRLTAAQALLLVGEMDLALAELSILRQQRPFGDEGLEGGLSEMELLAEQALGDEVLQTASYLVREINQSRHLNFTAKKETEFNARVINVLARLRATEEYGPAVETAGAVVSLFGEAESSIQKGVAFQDWGEATLKAGKSPGGDISREAFELARARFRGAGDAFATAAQEQFNTTKYVPTLWSAIDAYQRGRHFSKSIGLLEKYLRYEDRMKQPQGLVAHGRALLAEGQPEEAMKSLQTCIVEFPRDPMRYEAQLLAAQAAADSNDSEEAKALLQQNLVDGQLTPQSPIWRDSLHTLGELLYTESDLGTLATEELKLPEKIEALRKVEPKLTLALRRLNEATERYWPSPRSQAASYLFARGQLLAARLPDAEMENESLLDAAKRDLRQKSNRYRQTALDRFASLVRYLDNQQRDTELSEKQEATLRNSLLGQADTLKSMQRFTEAADAYRDMSLRYMNEPPALEALLGQARMVRLLGRDREADLLLNQAGVVLKKIDAKWDDRFEEMTRFNRGGWERYLTWINERNSQARRIGNPVR